MPRLCLHLSGAVIFSVTAGACCCHSPQPAPALWLPEDPPTHTPSPHPHSHSPHPPPQASRVSRQGGVFSDREGVRLGSPLKGLTQLGLPRSLLLIHSIALSPRPVQCYRSLVTLSRKRSDFSTKAQDFAVQKQPALAPGKRDRKGGS